MFGTPGLDGVVFAGDGLAGGLLMLHVRAPPGSLTWPTPVYLLDQLPDLLRRLIRGKRVTGSAASLTPCSCRSTLKQCKWDQ